MATCPIAKYRDGAKALEYATKACELFDWKDRICLDTLAAAYAELGKFDKAVEYQEKAIELQTKAIEFISDKDKEDYRSRLELYKSGKPYRFDPMRAMRN